MPGLTDVVEAVVTEETLRAILAQRPNRQHGPVRLKPLAYAVEELKTRLREEFVAQSCEMDAPVSEAPRAPYEGLKWPLSVALQFRDNHVDALPSRRAQVMLDASPTLSHLTCLHCRRPVEVSAQLVRCPTQDPPTGDRHAYLSVLPDGGQFSFLQALLLGRSLTECGCCKERLLLHSPEVPEMYLSALAEYWSLKTIRDWTRVTNWSPRGKAGKAAVRLIGLQQTQFDKVLLLELGCVAQHNLDELFELACPAGRQRDGEGTLDTTILLLKPSVDAFRRMAEEVGSEMAVWPRRGTFSLSLEDYLLKFYNVFFGGRWCEIPSDFAGVTSPKQRIWCWLEQNSTMLLSGEDVEPPEGAAVLSSILAAPGLFHLLSTVQRDRCADCDGYDEAGIQDPVDDVWRCHWCWEAKLMEDERQEEVVQPLSVSGMEQLSKDLGPFFLHQAGRQRWTWESGWIEFRQGGVLWTKNFGIGSWNVATSHSNPSLVVHLATFDSEVRHWLRMSGDVGGEGLDECWREIFRPLGFKRQAMGQERFIKCWPCRDTSRVSGSRNRLGRCEVADGPRPSAGERILVRS